MCLTLSPQWRVSSSVSAHLVRCRKFRPEGRCAIFTFYHTHRAVPAYDCTQTDTGCCCAVISVRLLLSSLLESKYVRIMVLMSSNTVSKLYAFVSRTLALHDWKAATHRILLRAEHCLCNGFRANIHDRNKGVPAFAHLPRPNCHFRSIWMGM